MNKKILISLCLLTLTTVSTCQAGPQYDSMDALVAANSSPTTVNQPAARSLQYVNRAYVANGQNYQPMTNNSNFNQRGLASWYAANLEGRLTSSGEPYNPNELTAAHPTLPIPSYVRVTHLGSGRSVVVRINDHAPFVDGRIINLSRAAAEELNIINAGMAQVEIQSVPAPDSNSREDDNRMANNQADDAIGQVAMRFAGR